MTPKEKQQRISQTVSNDKVKQEVTPRMEWDQIVLGAGPPCFFVEQVDGRRSRYCARPETWRGHNSRHSRHTFVSLRSLLATVRKEEREAAFRDVLMVAKANLKIGATDALDAGWNLALAEIIAALKASANSESKNNET